MTTQQILAGATLLAAGTVTLFKFPPYIASCTIGPD